MLTEVKEYACEYNVAPKDDDLILAMNIAKENHCIVKITWVMKWSGHYSIFVQESDSFEEVKARLPKVYGM